MNAVSLDNVCKSFSDVQAVDALSIDVPKGSIYGFLGPNGAGKTTTLRMIMDIIRPDSGRIEVLSHTPVSRVKERIGYMPEERGLYRKMTVARVLAYFGSLKGLSTAELAFRVPQWLARMELNGWANKKVEELSRGMHQKLQFAVTCINEPDLLILDEPFSGLDPVNLDLLKGVILDMRSNGTTVIFSTHVMHEAESLCEYIVLINKGKAICSGVLDEIRGDRRPRSVSVEIEGDGGFIETLEMVESVNHHGRRMEVALTGGADPQEFLQTVAGRSVVLAFEVKLPSLHEIFVNLVGADNADDANNGKDTQDSSA
ncbi:MAG: ATP-binding cassette domain-containing protein [Phycisphaerae bacterium]|jgi:ABC-2 type transport system ATP-binding protein|nr:ATP-binding cassette domain-containing protein [Phycisphaerae bacterium]